MRKSVPFIMLSSLSVVGLLSGCATFPAGGPFGQPSAGPSQSPSVNPSNQVATSRASEAAAIEIATINQTNSDMSFTFNQPIQGFRIISGEAALFVGSTKDSVTFQRSRYANVIITGLVTATGGQQQFVTLRIPQASSPVTTPAGQSSNSTAGGTPPSTNSAAQGQSANSAAGNQAASNSKNASNVSNSTGASNSSNSSNSTKPVTFPVHAGTAAPVIYFGPATGRRIYITVDDGWVPSQRVLQLMKQQHVPITTFLIENAAKENLSYWKDFVAAGGVIQDHTIDHPWLSKIPYQQDLAEWKGPVDMYPQWFGQTPTLGRPPYGAINQNTLVAAHDAGLQAIVMWSAEFNPSKPSAGLETWNGKPLAPGDIVLLHWQSGLYNQIEQVLAICKQQNLVPAPLILSPSQSTNTQSSSSQSKQTTSGKSSNSTSSNSTSSNAAASNSAASNSTTSTNTPSNTAQSSGNGSGKSK